MQRASHGAGAACSSSVATIASATTPDDRQHDCGEQPCPDRHERNDPGRVKPDIVRSSP
jgi:hypothetical protein